MFGYVQPLKPELKMKEYEAFKGYYCGLCKAIKKNYTNAARFMLNYDCAVLSLLFSSMSDDMPRVCRERCIASPLKKKTVIHTQESSYAAGVNVLLGCAKINDTAIDDKKFYARVLSVLFSSVNKRSARAYQELAGTFDKRLKALHVLEQQKCADIDAVANEFAHLLGAAFSLAPFGFLDEPARKTLWHMGYNLGRWIYIADAVDDIEKDYKKGSYNVFLQRGQGDAQAIRASVQDEALFNMNYSLAEACKAYELLNIKRDKPLLDNIMYLGLLKKHRIY